MTYEEAAEEILKGAFEVCEYCKGSPGGFRVHDEYSICAHCVGYGQLYRVGYLNACRILAIEPTPRPLSEFQKQEQIMWSRTSRDAADSQAYYREMVMESSPFKLDMDALTMKSWSKIRQRMLDTKKPKSE